MNGYVVGGYVVQHSMEWLPSPWRVATILGEKVSRNFNFPVYLSLITEGIHLGHVLVESNKQDIQVLPRIFTAYQEENGNYSAVYGTAEEFHEATEGLCVDRNGEETIIEYPNTFLALFIELEERHAYAVMRDGYLDFYNVVEIGE